MSNYEMVREFHQVFGAELRDTPSMQTSDAELKVLRGNLIYEECREVLDALDFNDIAHLAKELADLLYVVYGTAASFGIPMDAVFAEVHRSNMSKAGEDGKPILRDDGKVLKGPNYFQADVQKILQEAV